MSLSSSASGPMSLFSSLRTEHLVQPILLSTTFFALGYQLRPLLAPTSSSSSTQRRLSSAAPPAKRARLQSDEDEATDTESEAEDEAAATRANVGSVRARDSEEVKLVLVVNDSLKMSKGKIAAQAGHATLACAFMVKEQNPKLFQRWRQQGQPKIALRCATTEELDKLAAQARAQNLCARTIQDAGRTQVAPGSKTILGIGPGPARIINNVTGKLKLL